MYNNKKIIAIVPARGGSKGLPRKNLCDLNGKSLLAWTFDSAQNSKYIDRVILSSEDKEIISRAEEIGFEIPFIRPKELATDEATSMDVVIHAIQELTEGDTYILLQPTSPLRTTFDIDRCIELQENSKAPSCVSVCQPEKSAYWMFKQDKDSIEPLFGWSYFEKRRQDLPKLYTVNGAIYVASKNTLLDIKTFFIPGMKFYEMPPERSVDIDNELDLLFCSRILYKEKERK